MSIERRTRTVTIASGKGGAGKTSISLNLAICLSELGSRACLFDADLGLGNVNIMLGLNPEHDLEDVITEGFGLSDILIKNCHGIDIIPGSSGIEKMANLDGSDLEKLTAPFSELEGYDFLIFDTSAGVSRNVLAFCLASAEVVVILNPEPTSLTDAYSLLKILTLNRFAGTAMVVVNQAKSIKSAKGVFDKFKEVVQAHLRMEISLLGIVLQDPLVSEAVKSQQPLVLRYPDANGSKCIRVAARNLLEKRPADCDFLGVRPFLERVLGVLKNPLGLKGFKNQPRQQPAESLDSGLRRNDGAETKPHEPASAVPLEAEPSGNPSSTPSSSPGAVPGNGDMLDLLNRLIDTVSSVSKEIHLMRTTGKEDEKTEADPSSGNRGQGEDRRQPSIKLDFEAFAKQHSATRRTGEDDS